MKKLLFVALCTTSLLTGCASVPMQDDVARQEAISGNPAEGQARVYLYRESALTGKALYKDLFIDGQCVGETAPGVFFFADVEGNKEHVISTESEFSPNHLKLYLEANKRYFVRQFLKMGVFVGGANLELMSEEEGLNALQECKLGVPGTCEAGSSISVSDEVTKAD